MEKKKSRKIGKYLVIALIVLGMLVYFLFHLLMLQ